MPGERSPYGQTEPGYDDVKPRRERAGPVAKFSRERERRGQLAGAVTGKKHQKHTTSDWMELERKRGISVSSTVLQFDYHGHRINLLDTPGHKDFSEDTYRVLTAVDAAIMVIDGAKGIEVETRKLFEVCRQRGIPLFTFINKLDLPSRDPMELLDELESVLGIGAYPVNWPVGNGRSFQGVYDRRGHALHLFERTPHGTYLAPVEVRDLHDPAVDERLDPDSLATVCEEVETLDEAGAAFDSEAVQSGGQTPVFFGSAANNFGIQLLLNAFAASAPSPSPRATAKGMVSPEHEPFSAFIFKIQANMDKRHRDRVAFVRIVSGRFRREMTVTHAQSGRQIRLANAQIAFGRDRETVDEAFPGDVVGFIGGCDFKVGDTLTENPGLVYDEIPRFPPECFAYLHNPTPSQFKRCNQGLTQLLQEGVVQGFTLPRRRQKVQLLGAVGPLQFDTVQHRLRAEYGADSRLESAPWSHARWLDPSSLDEPVEKLVLPSSCELAEDGSGHSLLLFSGEWDERYFRGQNPDINLLSSPPPSPVIAGTDR